MFALRDISTRYLVTRAILGTFSVYVICEQFWDYFATAFPGFRFFLTESHFEKISREQFKGKMVELILEFFVLFIIMLFAIAIQFLLAITFCKLMLKYIKED